VSPRWAWIGRAGTAYVAALAACLAACGEPQRGGAGTAPQQVTQEENTTCLNVPSGALRSLRASLEPGHQIARSAAVFAAGSVAGPADLAHGVYFVTADVRPNPGLATWAFGGLAFRTGGGIIVGVDPAARCVSDLGADIPPDRLGEWGLTESAVGYRASRDCFR
jgi:hypothetical protein